MSTTRDASVTRLCPSRGGSSGGCHATLVDTGVKDKG